MENIQTNKLGQLDPVVSKEKPHARAYNPEEIDQLPGQEVKDKRTSTSKVFSLGGNLFQSILYPDPVHYQDMKTGQWKEIDNTLIPESAKGIQDSLTNRDNGNLKVRLSPASSEQMVTLENMDGRMLSWTFDGAQAVSPKMLQLPILGRDGHDMRRKVLEKSEGRAVYENILQETDMVCTVLPDGFKDEIIFKSPEAVQPVTFLLTAPGLVLSRLENGVLEVVAPTGETAFSLPPPLMTDSAPESEIGAVNVSLARVEGKDQWRLTYVPDMEWVAKAVFPVTLDPLVFTKQHSDAIEDNFVTSTSPNTVQPYAGTGLRISYNSGTYGTSKAYIKFLDANLPPIDSSYYVTKAYFSIALKTTPTTSASVYLKEVLGNWSSTTITYNNQPAVQAMPLDYMYMETTHGAGSRYVYDISNLVRRWYAGANFGVMLESTITTSMELYSSDYAYAKPYVAINYVSLAGLEGSLAYETQSLGRAGTGHVSLYNGNLIFEHQDSACNGNLLPLSVTHYYNSCYKDIDAFHLGYGWKHSLQQTLHRETIPDEGGTNVTYYVYTDSDGTRHHFKKPTLSSTYFEDLSGLSMKLTISGNTVTVKDKGDNAMIFDLPTVDFGDNYANVKMLKSIQDAQGTTATFTSNGMDVSNAADGAGRNTTFTITGGRLSQMNAPGYSGNGVSFSYNGAGQLIQITHEDAAVTTYTYNGLGLLETATNHDGLKATYEYYSTRVPYRVKKVTISNGATVGNSREYEYGDCLTTVTDLTVAGGKKLYYHFNDYGNVVSVNDQLGYAAFAKYSDSLPINHPEVASKMQRVVCNLLPNHSFEVDGTWNTANSGSAGTFSYGTDQKYTGTRSRKIVKTSAAGAMSISLTRALEIGKTYTLSCYMRTEGAVVGCATATYTNTSGTGLWFDGQMLSSVGEWTRITTTFTLGTDAASPNVTLYFVASTGTGTVWFDCAQLEEGTVANRYNMMLNGDFSFNSGAHPTDWQKNASNTTADIVYTTYDGVKPEGLSANTMRMYGTGRTKYAGIYQDIPCIGNAGDVFVAGGWSMNHSKPRKGENFRYDIRVAFLQTGTSTRVNTPSIEWSEEWSGWQFAAGPVIAPCNYTSIRFNVDYERNINYTDFDGFFLHKEEFGQTFAYDSNKNITSVKNLAGEKSNATYDAFDNMLTYRQPGRPDTVKTTLEYGTTDTEKKKHLVRKSTDPMGVAKAFTYDDKGNVTAAQTQNGAGTSFIKGTTAYTANQNYVASQTDARGKTVTSNIDLTKGTLDSVTDPNSQAVNYTYDTLKRVTDTTATADTKTYKNEYVYTADKLTQVKHNTISDTVSDVVYNFAYDTLANPTTVQVGTQTLSTNVYTSTGDKLLKEVQYGNGGKVEYVRDGFKRVTGIRYDGVATDRYQYSFGANGQVAQVKDNNLNRVITHEHDAANRLMQVRQMEGTTHLYTSTLGYDTYNNLSSFKEKVATTNYETTYAYDNGNRPTTVQFGSVSNKVGYAYDALGRVSTRTATVGGTNYATTYTFTEGGHSTGSETALISGISQPNYNIYYTYDNVGNIATEFIEKPEYPLGRVIYYHYDKLGQLIRTDNQRDGETWVYQYDRGGNILQNACYEYTLDENPGTPWFTTVYTYGDGNWKDKLTAYNGTAITYDAIGNPLNDGTWTYTWQAGRQLASMTKSGTTATFAYNADGLRLRKTVNGTVTDYTLHEKQVVHLKKGSDNLHFFYDAQGRPAIVDFNGVKYGYMHNLQGDIASIIDASGNRVVEYTYDAWGQFLTRTGTLAATLGTLNPFRYRGYVFDEETGLYYLRSRYYNPVWGRFVNADNDTNGAGLFSYNVFAYCVNSPIINSDINGNDFLSDAGDYFSALWEGMGRRSVAAWSDPSFYNIANYLTMGVVEANAQRFEAVKEEPSFYSIGNYLTSGAFGVIKGTLAPEEPLSFNHWMDSFATVTLLMPIGRSAGRGIRNNMFKGNGGYGFKVGPKIEMLYETPKVGGGSIFSYNNGRGLRWRIDLDDLRGLHFHYGTGKMGRLHRPLNLAELINVYKEMK